MAHVILKCVLEDSRLRIRFHAYVDENGEHTSNVYNNQYNCRFPRNIRAVNRFYKVLISDLTLNSTRTKPFYCIKNKNIEILNSYAPIFRLDECVICLESTPSVTFSPCGHQICCASCYDIYKREKKNCPLCRREIEETRTGVH